MRISYNWLKDYIDAPLPSAEKVAEALTMHSFEVEDVEKTGSDTIFEIAVLPNRSHDCLSYVGISREVAALFELPLKLPKFEFEGDSGVNTGEHVNLVPPDPKLVRRAMKRLAVEVRVGESPAWLKEKLAAHGQRSINNVVDATNFVMWETGQPVHAFDYDKLVGDGVKEISIRSAKAGEKVTTLDGKELMLEEGMLVIADSEKALDIAGVKGGNNSGIDESTKRVLLSACTFHPISIRKTSRKLNVLTDASKRFEQEISPVLAERGMARLSQILLEIADAKVAQDVIDFYPKKRHPYFVGASLTEINGLLGAHLSDNDVQNALNRLGLKWKHVDPVVDILEHAPTLSGVPYKYAVSISYDAPSAFDCSSFIAYLHAQAGVAIPRITSDQFEYGVAIEEGDLRPGDVVFAKRHDTNEVHTFELVRDGEKVTQHVQKTEIREFPGEAKGELYHNGLYLGEGKIMHASGKWHRGEVITEDLKKSPAFANIVGYRRMVTSNEPRYVVTPPPERLDLHAGSGYMVSGNSADLIEEIGRIYGYENIKPETPSSIPAPELNKTFYYTQKIRDILVGLGFSEVMTYAFQAEGEVAVANPLAEDKKYLRENLVSGLTESLELNIRNAAFLGGGATKVFEIGTVFKKDREYLLLGIVAEDKESVTTAFETIGSTLGKPLKSKDGCADLSAYIESLPDAGVLDDLQTIKSDAKFMSVSVYPFVLRDIAVWIPDAAENDVVEVVKKEAGELFVRGDQFDSFSKDGKTSYAYHLVFQSHEKTLSDSEVNAIMDRVTEMLNSRADWKVR